MFESLGDSLAEDVYGFLHRNNGTLPKDIVARTTPTLMRLIDDAAVSTLPEPILQWANETSRFLDPMDVSRLLRASVNVYLRAWHRHHGNQDLSSVANILYRVQRDVSDHFFGPHGTQDDNPQ
jgi:hypothetical protein